MTRIVFWRVVFIICLGAGSYLLAAQPAKKGFHAVGVVIGALGLLIGERNGARP